MEKIYMISCCIKNSVLKAIRESNDGKEQRLHEHNWTY